MGILNAFWLIVKQKLNEFLIPFIFNVTPMKAWPKLIVKQRTQMYTYEAAGMKESAVVNAYDTTSPFLASAN